MKKIYLIMFVFFISKTFSQTVSEINSYINIPNSSSFQKEIRIYKKVSISNTTEIFRIYQVSNKDWNVELLKVYIDVETQKINKFEVEKLNSKIDLQKTWNQFLNANVDFLPNIGDVNYKLRGKIEYEDRDDDFGSRKMLTIVDGIEYFCYFKDEKKSIQFEFNNAESYLKIYPNVDELISYSELLNIVRKEYKIWKN